MKLVIAIVRSEKLDAVRAALRKKDVCVMSVSQVLGYGAEPGLTEHYRSMTVEARRPKLRVEIAVNDGVADDVVAAITQSAGTGQVGDGKVFVMELEQCVRIRDRASGPWATGTPAPSGPQRQRILDQPAVVRPRSSALVCN
jgi:nitrogen regulatory protein P-II 2